MFKVFHRIKRFIFLVILIVLIGSLLFYLPVPYYVTQPGSVMELHQIVEVDQVEEHEGGSFGLVTVTVLKGSPALYLYARLSPAADLVPFQRVLREDESPKEYRERQLEAMKQSQDHAILAAYLLAGDERDVFATAHLEGVRVIRTISGMPAEKVLQPGDVIREIDGTAVKDVDDLLTFLKAAQPEEEATLFIEREGEERELKVRLGSLPEVEGGRGEENRVGLGIYPVTHRIVEASPPVRINTAKVGGPSAGLMMALEIYNQLIPLDLTKGYRIAGTGTIDPKGKVGQIGSVEHKVVTAAANDTDLFFVPKDVAPTDDNEAAALRKAQELKTEMKIVPVATLEEAVHYLERLPSASEDGT